MTCIVLVQNPSGGGILTINEGEENDEVVQYDTVEEARADLRDQPLVKAWCGYVVDLDNLEVTLI